MWERGVFLLMAKWVKKEGTWMRGYPEDMDLNLTGSVGVRGDHADLSQQNCRKIQRDREAQKYRGKKTVSK